MSALHRHLAPISPEAWKEIDCEATCTLKRLLAARKLVDFSGPLGWATSAIGLGRTQRLAAGPAKGAEVRLRLAQPMVEIRVPFELEREELDSIARGAADPGLEPVAHASRTAATAEDRAVFSGYDSGGIVGIVGCAEASLKLPRDYTQYPRMVAEATNLLRHRGVDGPYALALGPDCHTGLTQTTHEGYPVMEHVRRLLDGPLIWAPTLDGAVVLSMRGGDFELSVGRDLAIGYMEHSATTVRLFIEESFTFRVLSPEAAVPLTYDSSRKKRSA